MLGGGYARDGALADGEVREVFKELTEIIFYSFIHSFVRSFICSFYIRCARC